MDQTLITVLRYSITYYQKNLFICAHYANKHKATALHKAYWLPCLYIDRLRPIHTNRKWKQKRIFTLMFETFTLVSFHVDFRLV